MNTIEKIEEVLGIKLEEKKCRELYELNQNNTYSIRKEAIESLVLDNVVIDNFSRLEPYLKELRELEINNSTVSNFSELLMPSCYYLRLNNVVFRNSDCDRMSSFPSHLIFSNLTIDARSFKCWKADKHVAFRQIEFKHCHIENIQEIEAIEATNLIEFDHLTFTDSPKVLKKNSQGPRRLSILNTNFKDASFIPFKGSVEDLQFLNCQINDLTDILNFQKINKVEIDSDTTIENKTTQDNPLKKAIDFTLIQGQKPIDLRNILPFKEYIYKIRLDKYEEATIDFISEFNRIKNLSFCGSTVYVDAFLPIAEQVETIEFYECSIKNHQYFNSFNKLKHFESISYEDGHNGINTFKTILPLKKHLKVLVINEEREIKDSHLLKDFMALESLVLKHDILAPTAESALTLKNLKRLSLSIDDEERTFNLAKLTQLEFLVLVTANHFVGFEYLNKLKSLRIDDFKCDPNIVFDALPHVNSLRRINLTCYDHEIEGLEKFSNLEALKIKGCSQIKLGEFRNLKVLDLENSSIQDFSNFEKTPSLEKLDLSSLQSEIDLQDIYKFPNLKYLTFLESRLNDISSLEALKQLEYLDLFSTEVSDIRVLNSLPNLIGVNISSWSHLVSHNLEEQIEEPEVVVHYGLTPTFISIWEDDEFGI